MTTYRLAMFSAAAGLLLSCATVPQELTNARAAYQRASTGPAADVAPAELHVAQQALARAEQSFDKKPDSFKTRDLAYVAQRKAELAEAVASIAIEQKTQARARDAYDKAQTQIIADTRQDLTMTRDELEAARRQEALREKDMRATTDKLQTAQQSGAMTEQELARARLDLEATKRSGAMTEQELAQVAADLEAAKRSSEMTAQKLLAEQVARTAAEKQAADAQRALAKLAEVKEDPRGTIITLSGSVLFASNQSTLLPSAKARLDQVAAVLLTTRERNLTVEGHTDSRGSDSANLTLSQRRADAVRSYLVQHDYEPDRIQALGMGEGQPVADNSSPEGRANNRRVEIVIARESHTSNP